MASRTALDLESLLFALAVVLIVVPALLFGIELIAFGVVFAASIVARGLLRRPWLIEAVAKSGPASGRVVEREAVGWRGSTATIDRLVADIGAGREPFGAAAAHASVPPPA